MRKVNPASRLLALLVSLLLIAAADPAQADESRMMEILIQKLVKKGVLTQEEAQEIRKEVAEEAAATSKTAPAGQAQETVKAAQSSSWLDRVKWAGDLRLRHETQRREPAVDRYRERFRLRFGFVANPVDPLEVGIRLATGASGDPVSTNQSFTGTFDKKAIFIDQAYGKYTPWKESAGPLSGLSLTGGKMENPFVTTQEIVWDADVTPEGVALQWKNPAGPIKPFLNAGAFQLSELNNDAGDPGLFGYQGGTDIDLPFWGATFQPALAYYDFTGIQGVNTSNFNNAPAGNSTVTQATQAKFASDYNLVAATAKLTFPKVFDRPLSFLADYTHNDDSDRDDDGAYAVGAELGKVSEKFGSWKAFYFRKRVESDATFGPLTDSDFGAGGTNHKGHILGLQLGLNKWANLAFKYIRTDEIEGTQNRVDTFQADLNLKY